MRRVAGICLALAACHGDPAAPAAHATPPPPPPLPAPPDAFVPPVDAERFALFDHVGILTVHLDRPARRATLPPGTVHAVALSVREHSAPESAPAEPPGLPPPPWMQTHVDKRAVDRVFHDPDGSWFVVAGQTLIVLGADHTPEVGLDFSGVRDGIPGSENTEIFEGGNHAMTARVLQIRHVHRLGTLIVIATTLSDRLHDVLVGVDSTTGELVWASESNLGREDFAIFGGNAITSTRAGSAWVIDAIALDSGLLRATIPTKAGPYRLTTGSAAGEISGLVVGPDATPSQVSIHVALDPPPE